ncbi:MAG: nucleotidyltransferase domain-containing protein [Acidobacteria bacterium]|nr:MAG: nucleotidyltransferase domain-containing protein [Acidobacteriota bacterium]
MAVGEEKLNEIVRRIIQVAQPLRVVLFGSAARGTETSRSDLDILIVVKDGSHRRKVAQNVYRSFSGIGVATDIVVVTESDVAKYRDVPWMVIKPAFDEGKDLYVAA